MNNSRCHPSTLLLAAGLLGAGVAHAQDPARPDDPSRAEAAQPSPARSGAAVLRTHIMLAPDDVAWGACPPVLPPGAQCAVIEGDPAAANALFAMRARLPDNYRIPPHFHPADEHVVVISGILNMGLGDKFDTSAGHALPAGGFMAMPAGEHHYAWAKGDTVIQIYAVGPWSLTYVNPQDDPRQNPAQGGN